MRSKSFGRVGIRVVGMGLRSWGEEGMGGCDRMFALAVGGGEGWRVFEIVFEVGKGVCCGGRNEGVCKKGGRIWSDGACDLRL
jgi:hypothetical protein